MHKLKILLAEDMAHERLVIETRLKKALEPHMEAVFTSVECGEDAVAYAKTSNFDLVIMDLDFSHSAKSQGLDGLSASRRIKVQNKELRVVVVSSNEEEATMREAVDEYSVDWYLRRSSISYEELAWQARQGLLARLHRDGMLVEERYRFLTMNTRAKEILARVDAVLPQQNILIYGETGTGKELIAQRIHANARAFDPKRPLKVLDCSSLSPQLFESEVFGHRKGAFTGANTDRAGALELVNGGDLFLDEIHNIPIHLQQKLLRVLNDGVFSPIGSNIELRSRFRVIAATNIPVADAIQSGKLLADFVERIRKIKIDLLPLRDRPDDIPLLVKNHIQSTENADKEFSIDALQFMKTLPWNGNTRELKSVIDTLMAEVKIPVISRIDVSSRFSNNQISPKASAEINEVHSIVDHLLSEDIPLKSLIDTLEKSYLQKASHKFQSVRELAQTTGYDRTTLSRRLREFGIHL